MQYAGFNYLKVKLCFVLHKRRTPLSALHIQEDELSVLKALTQRAKRISLHSIYLSGVCRAHAE